MWKTVLAVWGSTAIAIGISVYFTRDMRCLWFLIIPALMSFKSELPDSNSKKKSQYNGPRLERGIDGNIYKVTDLDNGKKIYTCEEKK